MAKLLEAQIHEETKLWSLIVLCLSRSKYARKKQWREENKVRKTEDGSCSFPLHLWSTSRSPFSTCLYHFKAQEVKNPTLQTMYDLELKWGRYGLRKTTASSWRTNSHLMNLELQHAKLKPNLRKWFCNLQTWILTCESGF